jgi:hypothetical protein
MKHDIRFAAILATTTNPVPHDFKGIELPDHIKWEAPPIKYFEHPISNNRHERRKRKAMKRKNANKL